MLPRENLPRRGPGGRPARHGFAYRALGLATAALLMTACSPAVFHPVSTQDAGSSAAPGDHPLRALAAEQERLASGQAEAEAPRQRLADETDEEESADAEDPVEDEDQAGAEAPDEEDLRAVPAPDESTPEGSTPEDPDPETPEDPDSEDSDAAPEDPEQSQPATPADTPSFTGDLDSYLDELVAFHPGDISISVAELGGQGRTGSSAGAESRVSASTYKVYVAYGILSRVESGEMDWDDPIEGGRDRATCFADMISVSDNPCADAFRGELGWEGLRDIAADTGGPATDFIPAYARSSANDLTAFMTRLESGSLDISAEGRSRLLDALESNIFRDGIDAGSSGSVLNKVGFIDGYLNDTAIVRHPEGTYVLSIMSDGSDWDSISTFTRDVEAALY
ncbi:serine hydrolase [Nesterenkonia sp. DZ6]|uniref:serine hydrolase n=1 Tax=Nesterenkonia sp. DZ6 TaxID=2901229 RepID=UPI001F4CB44C|nr:serine hydrolase [Nesterenkonia sp. DZ6]MCH8561096.1 serine hydrolase [Nesterenkonia sp. DZ6]